jgi:hypothetical protein
MNCGSEQMAVPDTESFAAYMLQSFSVMREYNRFRLVHRAGQ